MKSYRVWIKKTKDTEKPDYYIDTLAENASQASLDAEKYTGHYVDLVVPKMNVNVVGATENIMDILTGNKK